MSQHLCGCGEPAPDSTLCRGCTRRLELALGDVPALSADLDNVITRQTSYAEQQQRVSGSTETSVPFHVAAAKVGEDLRAILPSWVRIVHEERYEAPGRHLSATETPANANGVVPDPPTPGNAKTGGTRALPADNVPACARWLLGEVAWIAQQQWADACYANVIDVVGRLRRALDAPPIRTTINVGPCPEPGCPGEVRAFIPRDPDTMAHADCTAEPEHRWDSTQWLRLGKRMIREVSA